MRHNQAARSGTALLVVALSFVSLAILGSQAATAAPPAKVTNPGAVTFKITGGKVKLGTGINFAIKASDQLELKGSVTSTGALSFGKQQLKQIFATSAHDGNEQIVTLRTTSTGTGTVNPAAGTASLSLKLNADITENEADCKTTGDFDVIGASTSTLSGGYDYQPSDGSLTLAQKSFSAPGLIGLEPEYNDQCAALSQVFDLPATSGNEIVLEGKLTPAPLPSGLVQEPSLVNLNSGQIYLSTSQDEPFEVTEANMFRIRGKLAADGTSIEFDQNVQQVLGKVSISDSSQITFTAKDREARFTAATGKFEFHARLGVIVEYADGTQCTSTSSLINKLSTEHSPTADRIKADGSLRLNSVNDLILPKATVTADPTGTGAATCNAFSTAYGLGKNSSGGMGFVGNVRGLAIDPPLPDPDPTPDPDQGTTPDPDDTVTGGEPTGGTPSTDPVRQSEPDTKPQSTSSGSAKLVLAPKASLGKRKQAVELQVRCDGQQGLQCAGTIKATATVRYKQGGKARRLRVLLRSSYRVAAGKMVVVKFRPASKVKQVLRAKRKTQFVVVTSSVASAGQKATSTTGRLTVIATR